MNFVLAAGGTGGHMVPAHALAAELKSRGHGVLLITDERGARFPGLFEGCRCTSFRRGGWRRADRLAEGRGRRCCKRPARGEAPLPRAPARRGHRLRRLSGLPVAARCERDAHPDRAPRAECGARPRQPPPRGRRRGDRHRLRRGRPAEAALRRRRRCWSAIPSATRSRKLGELPFPPFDEIAPLKILVTGGSQGATVLEQGRAGGAGPAPALASPPAAGRAAVPARRHRASPQHAMPSSASRPS